MKLKFLEKIKNKFKEWKLSRDISKTIEGGSGAYTPKTDSLGLFSGTDAIADAGYVQDDTKRKYQEGFVMLRKALEEQAIEEGGKSKENYEKVMGRYTSDTDEWTKDLTKKDLLKLTNEEESYTHKVVKKSKIYSTADIQSEEDKTKMIQTRIEHYKVLQVKRQIRKLNSELRKAEKSGDKEKIQDLWEQINEHQRSLRT